MKIRLNGADAQTESQTVAALLEELGFGVQGVAVAVNEAVVPRAKHAEFELQSGDVVEIIRAVQGG